MAEAERQQLLTKISRQMGHTQAMEKDYRHVPPYHGPTPPPCPGQSSVGPGVQLPAVRAPVIPAYR